MAADGDKEQQPRFALKMSDTAGWLASASTAGRWWTGGTDRKVKRMQGKVKGLLDCTGIVAHIWEKSRMQGQTRKHYA